MRRERLRKRPVAGAAYWMAASHLSRACWPLERSFPIYISSFSPLLYLPPLSIDAHEPSLQDMRGSGLEATAGLRIRAKASYRHSVRYTTLSLYCLYVCACVCVVWSYGGGDVGSGGGGAAAAASAGH